MARPPIALAALLALVLAGCSDAEGGAAPADADVADALAPNGSASEVPAALDALFCSARVDCSYATESGEAPILLLEDAAGERARTLVLGFACTGAEDADFHLYMDALTIDCGAAGTTTLSTGAPSGRLLGAAAPLVFEHVAYRGEERLGDWGAIKRFWNLAVGVAEGALPNDAVCTLRLRAAASERPLSGDVLRPDDSWHALRFEVPLNTPPGDALTCGQNQLAFDAPAAIMVDDAPQAPFPWSYP
ncbi:MAG: hypothetical protein EP329_19595 [Deltaproteobacteria bacterium]|nr:MAG: hypothetical protein EP329_19595 [Deltaproteobacteria bacterium]